MLPKILTIPALLGTIAMPLWAQAHQPLPAGQSSGYWSYAPDWKTELIEHGDARSCVTTTDPRTHGGIEFQFMLSFGDRNEFVLKANRAFAPTETATLETADGGGLDMAAIEFRREGPLYIAANSVSRSMFRLILEDLRNNPSAVFRINGVEYPISLTNFGDAYRAMLACQRTMLGVVIGDLD